MKKTFFVVKDEFNNKFTQDFDVYIAIKNSYFIDFQSLAKQFYSSCGYNVAKSLRFLEENNYIESFEINDIVLEKLRKLKALK